MDSTRSYMYLINATVGRNVTESKPVDTLPFDYPVEDVADVCANKHPAV